MITMVIDVVLAVHCIASVPPCSLKRYACRFRGESGKIERDFMRAELRASTPALGEFRVYSAGIAKPGDIGFVRQAPACR